MIAYYFHFIKTHISLAIKKEQYKMYCSFKQMDGEGFEPSKQICSGFTVRPLWPLGNPSIYYEFANANSQNKIT